MVVILAGQHMIQKARPGHGLCAQRAANQRHPREATAGRRRRERPLPPPLLAPQAPAGVAELCGDLCLKAILP